MHLMFSAIAFIIVTVFTYPLYQSIGGIAFLIAGISGIAVAILSYQVMLKKNLHHQQEFNQLAALLTSSNNEVVQSLTAHTNQIDENLQNVTKDLHRKLEKTWESFQDINEKNYHHTTEQFQRIITQVEDVQKVQQEKQQELFENIENMWNQLVSKLEQSNSGLVEVWTTIQQQMYDLRKQEQDLLTDTFARVSSSNNEVNQQLLETWQSVQAGIIQIRQEEQEQLKLVRMEDQEKLKAILAVMEQKEQVFSSFLVELKDTTAQTQQTLIEAVATTNTETNNRLLEAWNTVQTGIIALQQTEQEKLSATLQAMEEKERAYGDYIVKAQEHAEHAQQQLLLLLDERVKAQNSELLSSWNELQKDSKRLREQEHTSILELLDVIVEKDQSIREHLTQQSVVFNEAQKDFKESFHVQTQALYGELFVVWNKTQNEAAEIRQSEQQSLQGVLARLEEKEQNLLANVEKLQLQLAAEAVNRAEAINTKLIEAWNEAQSQVLLLRQQEKEHLEGILTNVELKERAFVNYLEVLTEKTEESQQQLVSIIGQNAQEANEQITEKWTSTQQQLLDLRSMEQKDVQQLIERLDQQSNLFMEQLEQQNQTFVDAQQYYGNATDTITEFIDRIADHSKQVNEQHERLVQAQELLEKSITTTFKEILGNHNSVLTNAEESLKSGIAVLQKEGLENQKALIENVEGIFEEVHEMRNSQEEIMKDLTAKFNTNIRNLHGAIIDSTTKQTRSVEQYKMSLEETLNRLDSLITSEQSAQKELSTQLRAQTFEMQESANILRSTYDELKAMNSEDMKILAQLIK